MAVWNVVNLAEVAGAGRLDAEYYQRSYYEALERVAMSKPCMMVKLGDMLTYCSNGHTPLRHDLAEGDIPFLTAEHVADFEIDYDTTKRILTEHDRGELARTSLRNGDILVTIKGKIGNAAIVENLTGRVNINQDVALLRTSSQIPPYFLAGYLNSSVGKLLVKRASTNQINPFLSLGNLKDLPIPLYPAEKMSHCDDRCRETLQEGFRKRLYAKQRYAEAESLLESALGMDKLDLTPRLFYERSYKDAADAGRLDAEYFNPRAQNLIGALSRDRLRVADVAKLATRRFRPASGVEFQYIEIGDVGGSGAAESTPVMGEDAPSRATWIVKPGDVITTTVRPIRRLSAVITDDQAGHVCSSGFAVLTPTAVEPELLLAYLRLLLVCEVLDLHTTASMYPAISTADLMKIPISLPDDATRRQIVAKVRESFNARQEARRLLDEAKALVERAILSASGGGK